MGLTRIRAEQISDIDYKQAVRVIQRTNVTLSGGAPSSVDGVNLSANDRILVTGQDAGAQNGIYRVQTLGTGVNGTWVRTNDGNTDGEIEAGMIIMVTEGEVYKDTQWKLTTNNPIIIGTTSLTFVLNAVSVIGGENTQVQYNSGGTLAGSANLTFNGTSLTVGGNVTANYFLGDGSQLSGIITSVANINNGTSNVSIDVANANITMGVDGTANVVIVSATGMTVAGNLVPAANLVYSLGNATRQWANIYVGGNTIFLGSLQLKDSGANTLAVYGADGTTPGTISGTATLAEYVTQAAQGNITSVGTLTSLSVTGNITGGNLQINNNAVITGNLTVQGTETIFNVNTLTVNDKDIIVANNVTGGANVNGAGLLAGNPTVASWVYDDSTTSWQTNISVTPGSDGSLDLGRTGSRWNNAWLYSITATGNINAGNVIATGINGTLNTAYQPNITDVGTLNQLNVTGNVSAGNVLATSLVGTLTISSQPNITSVGTLLQLNVTGNVSAGNVGGTNLSGTLLTGTQPNITSIGTLVGLTVSGNASVGNLSVSGDAMVTGNISGANVISSTTLSISGNASANNQTLSGSLTLGGNIVDTGALSIISGSNGNITLAPNGSGLVVINSDLRNGQANGVGNIGTASGYFNTIFAKATSAQYADLAEIYESDKKYLPGTVVVFGGANEVTESTNYAQMSIAGVISTHPAHIMNAGSAGQPIALQGRVPCRVVGTIRKGDLVTSSDIAGVATRLDPQDWVPGSVIGKALEHYNSDKEGTIEVVVGRV